MILADSAIRSALAEGDIVIEPFADEQLNPNSYDVRLGDEVLSYEDSSLLDAVRREPRHRRQKIEATGIVLYPGVGYLMSTVERIGSRRFVPQIEGKSSIARLFVSVHQTAGFGDIGWVGNFTLEVTSLYPVRLYAGMRIAQVIFFETLGRVERPYAGSYVGDAASGPVPSRLWKKCVP